VTVGEGGIFIRIAETCDKAAYHEVMRWRQVLIAAASLALVAGASGAGFHDVKTVYILPMSGGLDEYLAVRLTTGIVLQVVTDPKKADAVLTDHLGESFQRSFDDLYGEAPAAGSDTSQTFARVGGGQRSKGTFFLVERKTRDVVWSDDERPKGNSADELRRVANRIAEHLSKAIKGK
jgi:hypothetical protein